MYFLIIICLISLFATQDTRVVSYIEYFESLLTLSQGKQASFNLVIVDEQVLAL